MTPSTASSWHLVLLVTLAVGCRSEQPDDSTSLATEVDGGAVVVEVTGDGGIQSYLVQDVAPGATVEHVMRSIDQIPITIRGTGTTAFVEGIGDVSTSANEGWTYKVDGEFVMQGIGSMQLNPPTTVTWTFGDATVIADQ